MPHAPVTARSLWWTPAADEADPGPQPPLAEDATADVLVVGAGILGATVAADLANAGLDVLVLESGRIGSGATGHSTAKVTALQSPRYAAIEQTHGPEAARTYAAASLAAVERLLAMGPAVGAGRDTALTWTHDPARAGEIDQEAKAAGRAGLAVRSASDDEFGLPIHRGIALDEQGFVDPRAAVRALASRARDDGARVHEGTAVTGVSLVGDRRVATTANGARVTADHVVLATGLPFLDRGLWFARTEPERAHALALRTRRRPTGMGLRIGTVRSSRAVPTGDGSWVTLVAGADHRTGEGADAPRAIDDLVDWADEAFGIEQVLQRWSAQDWRTTDHLPLVGSLVPGDDRVLAGSGFQKWGLTSGTAAAEVLTARILGRTVADIGRLLDPMRLRSTSQVGGLLRLNGHTGWALARGWVRLLAHGGDSQPGDGEGVVHLDGVHPTATSNLEGTTRACSAVCPHLGGIVSWEPADRAWGCPLHGSRFAPDGRVLSGPATRRLEGRGPS